MPRCLGVPLLLCVLFAAAPPRAGHALDKTAFTRPETVIKYDNGESTLALSGDRTVRVECRAYPRFAIMVESDPGLKGDNFTVRERPPHVSASELCGKAFRGNTTQWETQEYWLQGVVGPWAILVDEPFGRVNSFSVVDVRMGKRRVRDSYDEDEGVALREGKDGRWGLSFFRSLEVDCNPYSAPEACLKLVRKANHIPAAVDLEKPDCSKEYQAHPNDVRSGSVHLSTPVEIADIKHPEVRYLGGPVRCSWHP